MATIITVGLNKDKLTFNDKGWANIDIFLRDETNIYGQNASVVMSQSKDQRDQKQPKEYIGNGKVVWTDGKISTAEKVQKDELERQSLPQSETEY